MKNELPILGGMLTIGMTIGLICGYYFGQIHAWSQCEELCGAMLK